MLHQRREDHRVHAGLAQDPRPCGVVHVPVRRAAPRVDQARPQVTEGLRVRRREHEVARLAHLVQAGELRHRLEGRPAHRRRAAHRGQRRLVAVEDRVHQIHRRDIGEVLHCNGRQLPGCSHHAEAGSHPLVGRGEQLLCLTGAFLLGDIVDDRRRAEHRSALQQRQRQDAIDACPLADVALDDRVRAGCPVRIDHLGKQGTERKRRIEFRHAVVEQRHQAPRRGWPGRPGCCAGPSTRRHTSRVQRVLAKR